ncbi:P-loop containing nucleoside triphosphate hydrolase [Pseudocohnilembus persalinus]|uniref:p-loop containing nucleoside triphosphate hydrolase n=1 Tax=Pseudocohnilembus persalinus TaxID=266149 RepID=A0A0V0QD27_PSEPJ|nr:P-loop containing nucleoside triphosphate hydrolase [Pseudocohnilembus persalinus]|eukprot:KRX00131.1 P-loop containing nucleoside triphosphate hydrolase [Pseudocohnilembus persalinus]
MNTNESSRMTSNLNCTSRVKHKIIFLGDQYVGKTCIIERFMYDVFSEKSQATVGVDFLAKTLHIEDKNIRLQIWDTAGQERFRSLIPSYLRDATCAFIVFDITKPTTFNNVEQWIKEYREIRGQDAICVLVANKVDLAMSREVTQEQGQKKAEENKMRYFEISAKTGENIQNMFQTMAIQLQPQETTLNGTNAFNFNNDQNNKTINNNQQQPGQSQQNNNILPNNINGNQQQSQGQQQSAQQNQNIKLNNGTQNGQSNGANNQQIKKTNNCC